MAARDIVFISDSPAPREDDALDSYSRAVVFVAEKLSPSVANLRVSKRVRGGRVLEGAGSGVVITADGFLLTSAHVVAGSSGRGRASFADGRELDFDVVGTDALSDLAIEDVPTLQRLMVDELIDTPTAITIARNGQLLELTLVPAELPA